MKFPVSSTSAQWHFIARSSGISGVSRPS